MYNKSVAIRRALAAEYQALRALHNACSKAVGGSIQLSGDIIRDLRRDIRIKINLDPLQARSAMRCESQKCRYFYRGSLAMDYRIRYSSSEYFKKEFIQFIKGIIPDDKLHYKQDSFEFEGNFYSNREYFLFQNHVYDKSEWKLSKETGQLLNMNTDREYHINIGDKKIKGKIELTDGTTFVNNMYDYDSLINVVTTGSMNEVPYWIPESMIVVNGKRAGDRTTISMREEDLKTVEFKPLPVHGDIFRAIAGELSRIQNEPIEKSLERVRTCFLAYNNYKIELGHKFGKANTIAKRLLKKLIQGNLFENMNYAQLVEALKMIKHFFEDEKEVKRYVAEKGYPIN